MTLANKSTKVGAVVLQVGRERRRVQKDTGKNKAGESVLSLGFTMSK